MRKTGIAATAKSIVSADASSVLTREWCHAERLEGDRTTTLGSMRTLVIDHPLVAHKLTRLRREETSSATFRLLAEELGHGRILTTDARDFGAYRFKSQQPFQNLLLESAHG